MSLVRINQSTWVNPAQVVSVTNEPDDPWGYRTVVVTMADGSSHSVECEGLGQAVAMLTPDA